MAGVSLALLSLLVAIASVCPVHPATTPPDHELVISEVQEPISVEPGLPRQEVSTEQDVMKYLMQFGYIGKESDDPRTSSIKDASAVQEALRKFQGMVGLPQTGEMDTATKSLMSLPRCGVKDGDRHRRMRRYALEGSKWDDTDLTYKINSFTDDLPKSKVKAIFDSAFKTWSAVSPLTFTKKQRGSVDIEIEFGMGNHGDPYDFDGPGKTLAHAFFPAYGGDAHFDDAEYFTDGVHKGINLFQVAVHEFGHSLGLSHSDDKDALMYAIYRGYVSNFRLHQDDIDAVQALYGKKHIATTASPTTSSGPAEGGSSTTPRTTVAPSPGSCNAQFDAITSFKLPYRETQIVLAFSGKNYHILTGGKVITRSIKQDFKHVDQVDAAITKVSVYRTILFLFRGNMIYLYRVNSYGTNIRIQSLDSRPRSRISALVWRLPNDIDAIFTWSGNNKVYAFKGGEYFRLSGGRVAAGYPRPITAWGLPGTTRRVDAIMQHQRKTYFFIGKTYYRIDDRKLKMAGGYPRDIGQVWLRCRTSDMRIEPTESSYNTLENDGITRIKTTFQKEQTSSCPKVATHSSIVITAVLFTFGFLCQY